jgi:hypothetical protein
MTAVVHLQADNLQVEPGQTTTGQLSLSNTGTIVEQFTIMVLGDVAAWTHSDPPVVSLFPGGQQTVSLRFAPPRAYDTPSGPVPFAVKVIPSNEPEESVTEEGTITVGSFTDVGAELVPRVATGRITGRQKLAVDSRGNVPLPVAVGAVDAADALKFQFRPSKLTTAPGEARFVRMRVTPRQRFWKGPPQQKPYKVQVSPEGEQPLVLDGALSQKAILPKWLLPLAGVLAALALLWFFVLRPIVHNDAVNASKAAIQAQANATKALATQVVKANQAAAAASSNAATANSAASEAVNLAKKTTPAAKNTVIVNTPKPTVTTTTTTTTVKPPPVTAVTVDNDNELDVIAAPGSTNTGAAKVNPHSRLEITDIVLQNVAGKGTGFARIQRQLANGTKQNLLVENLADLTDQEFRFTTPMIFTSGESLVLSVDCGVAQGACEVSAYYTGPLNEPTKDTTTTSPA